MTPLITCNCIKCLIPGIEKKSNFRSRRDHSLITDYVINVAFISRFCSSVLMQTGYYFEFICQLIFRKKCRGKSFYLLQELGPFLDGFISWTPSYYSKNWVSKKNPSNKWDITLEMPYQQLVISSFN